MTKEETELIIKEQDKSTKEILKVIEKEKCELLGIIQGKDKAIQELEKENTRLKLELEALDGQIPWKDIKDKSEVLGKLTEAKDIIRQLLLLPYANNEEVNADVTSILDKAEFFLKGE